MKLSIKLFLPAYHNVTVHIILIYKEILRVQNYVAMIQPQFMKLSVKLFLPAYHNITVHIILIYKEILRGRNS